MKIALNWLSDYVKTSLNPEKLADRFVYTSSEVEGIIDWNQKYTNLVVGKVLEAIKHPDADKLSLTKVDVGNGQILSIVCGAPNVAANQKVVVAQVGAVIYAKNGESFTIKEATIRGQKSMGMLCSAEELGLADKSEGILELPESAQIGNSFAEYYNLNDTVLDLEITPNRADLMSYLGLAREVSTFEKKELIQPDLAILENQKLISNPITIEVDDSKIAPRFSSIYLENYKSESSPIWIQSRLRLSGIKPISLIVDVTNYVMLEMGQPLHCYDYDKLQEKEGKKTLRVRNGIENEKLFVLDNTEREIKSKDIIIADGTGAPLVIAGIMGGKESAISAQTTRIVLESATFSGSCIRNTSRRLGIRTEASSRYEKGLDTELTVKALKRVVYLLQSIQPAILFSNIHDVHSTYKKERPKIHLTFNQVSQIVGTNIPSNETKNILTKLGFQVNNFTKSGFEAVPPTWRADVSINEDVVEELVRIWGYDRIPTTLPSGKIFPPRPNEVFDNAFKIRRALSAAGFNEAVHLSLTSTENITRAGFKEDETIAAEYPLSKEMEKLIPSHLPNFLKNLATTNHQFSEVKMFEIGHIFHSDFTEEQVLSVVIQTQQDLVQVLRDWKSDFQRLISSLGEATDIVYGPSSQPNAYYRQGSKQDIVYQDKSIGQIGVVSEEILSGYKIKGKKTVLFAQFDLDLIARISANPIKYKEAFVFPSIERDLTIILNNSVLCRNLEAYLKQIKPALLQAWKIGSVYSGDGIPLGTRSVTINFEYNGLDRSLTDVEVNKVHQTIIDKLIKQFNLTIK